MPVHRAGRDCWQWGHHGTVYCGRGARARAERQGRAAFAHGYRWAREATGLRFSAGGDQLHRGQWDGWVAAYAGDDPDPVGRLSWQSWEQGGREHYLVKYVEVRPEWRRRSVATALYRELFRREGITVDQLDPASLTPEGAAFRRGARLEEAPDWRTALVPGDARYVPATVLPQMPDVVARALAAGAPAGQLEFVGAGMTGVVFCAGPIAYKVARDVRPIDHLIFEEEAEWLAAAAQVPEVAPHVARFESFDPDSLVIVRDCPKADPDSSAWRYGEGRLHDLHRQIERDMLPHGWTAPEFKPDSYVITKDGPILVDASMPSRVGQNLAQFVEDAAAGLRELWTVRPSDLAFHVRMERGRTLTDDEVDRLLSLIDRRWPDAGALQ